ncbi:MAG TPA: threonine-phosphate decarboxylase CobD [Alphaproteobacteria bacterium]
MTDAPDDLPVHGGDLAGAATRFGSPASNGISGGWLDLSTGINPQPYPFMPLDPALWHRLPQQAMQDALISAAASCYRVGERAAIVAAPGTQAILQWLPRLLPPAKVAVLAPTYGEYAPNWRAAGHEVTIIHELATAAAAQVVVLANPNNPDGRRIAPETLLALADDLAARDGWLVVDEAFADAEPEISLSARAGMAGLVLLRSFGKFYGLAGLRLGFALAPTDLATRLREALGPWAVSGPAQAIGAQALADRAWAADTRERLALASASLAGLLRRAGLASAGGAPLFQLVRHPQAAALYDHLGRQGILTRTFAEQPDWLRFGLPAARDVARLEAALASWSK